MILRRQPIWADLEPGELVKINTLLTELEQCAGSPTKQSARRMRTVLLNSMQTIQNLLDGSELR